MKDGENRDAGRSPVDPPVPPELPEAQDEVGRFVGVLLHNRADTARMLEILEAAGDADLLQIVEVRLLAMGEGSIANMAGDRRKSVLRAAAEAAGPQLEVLGEESRFLPCKLSEEEIRSFSRQGMELYKKVDEESDVLKEEVAERKAAIKLLKVEADGFRRYSLDGVQNRPVTVVKHWDSGTGEIVEIRTDTREVVERRKPTATESQTVLFQQTR